MKTGNLSAQARLLQKLGSLKNERDLYESRISAGLENLNGIISDPKPYIKAQLAELAADKEVTKNLLKIAVHFTSDYFIDKYVSTTGTPFLSGLLQKLKARSESGAFGGLIDKLWLFNTRLRRDGEHDGRNLIHWRNVEN